MKLTLAENIRAFRKARRLTQEQFAEMLNVTAGAVYKWESGMSVPELNLIVEMADFFDVSVDVLLGYRMKDNSLEAITDRLERYLRTRNPEALTEAEKALKKYPNNFRIVHLCAGVYLVFATEGRDKAKPRRALELLEQALSLIAQNEDPEIGELTIYGEIAMAYSLLGEEEKSIELLKRHNVNGVFDDAIGTGLALFLGRCQEAEPFLSDALLGSLGSLLNTVGGYALVLCARGDYAAARDILLWGLEALRGLKDESLSDSMDVACAQLLALLAHAQLKSGMADGARASMQRARAIARHFDSAPDYGLASLRFVHIPERASMHFYFGGNASEGVEKIIRLLDNQALLDLWNEVNDDE